MSKQTSVSSSLLLFFGPAWNLGERCALRCVSFGQESQMSDHWPNSMVRFAPLALDDKTVKPAIFAVISNTAFAFDLPVLPVQTVSILESLKETKAQRPSSLIRETTSSAGCDSESTPASLTLEKANRPHAARWSSRINCSRPG
jgi:hypothetical protein